MVGITKPPARDCLGPATLNGLMTRPRRPRPALLSTIASVRVFAIAYSILALYDVGTVIGSDSARWPLRPYTSAELTATSGTWSMTHRSMTPLVAATIECPSRPACRRIPAGPTCAAAWMTRSAPAKVPPPSR